MSYENSIVKFLKNEHCIGPENPMTGQRLMALCSREGLTDPQAIELSLGALLESGEVGMPANDHPLQVFWLTI